MGEFLVSELGKKIDTAGLTPEQVGQKAQGLLIDGEDWVEFRDDDSPAFIRFTVTLRKGAYIRVHQETLVQ